MRPVVSRISELNFEVPKVPEKEISVYREASYQYIRVSVRRTPYGGKDKFILITWYSDSHYLVT